MTARPVLVVLGAYALILPMPLMTQEGEAGCST